MRITVTKAETASAIGAAHSTPSTPIYTGKIRKSGIKQIKSLIRETIVANTGLPADIKKMDVIFTNSVNETSIKYMRKVFTANCQ